MVAKKWAGANVKDANKRAATIRAARNREGKWDALVAELSFARELIKPALLKEEPSLVDTTWLPYRYMSAFERTELFTVTYEALYKDLHGQYKDYHKAAGMQPVHPEYACNSRAEITSLWNARQHADAIGVPYGIFLRSSMDSAMKRKYGQVPRPNQLCTSWQVKAVEAAWEKESAIMPLFADDWDPRFFAPNNRVDAARRAALDMLFQKVQGRPPGSRAPTLASYMFQRLALSEAEARERWDDEVVDEAIKLGGTPTMLLAPAPKGSFRPHCLGMQQPVPALQCAGCFARVGCIKVRETVDKELQKTFGTKDPQQTRERLQAAERQRRCREKKREMLMKG